MKLYYAIGDGLGHVTRARAVISALGLKTEDVVVLGRKVPAHICARALDLDVVTLPEGSDDSNEDYQSEFHKLLEQIEPEEILVDTFPFGRHGEFLSEKINQRFPLTYIMRLLRLSEYLKIIDFSSWTKKTQFNLPTFGEILAVEEPSAEMCSLAQGMGLAESLGMTWPAKVTGLELGKDLGSAKGSLSWSQPVKEQTSQNKTDHVFSPSTWLVVHSGPPAEVEEILAYARQMARIENLNPHIMVSALFMPQGWAENNGVDLIDSYPVSQLYPFFARVITACGFNCMRELVDLRDRHYFLPLPRRFDDQFERARRARAFDRC